MIIQGVLEQTSLGTIKHWELIWHQFIFILTLGEFSCVAPADTQSWLAIGTDLSHFTEI
jgi:hypothetical protein